MNPGDWVYISERNNVNPGQYARVHQVMVENIAVMVTPSLCVTVPKNNLLPAGDI